jgi:O-antigen/teichoic acid export membrane protein
VQLVNAGSALVEPLSKTILARGVGLEAVALFELAWRVVATVAAAFLSATASLFPAAASLRSTGADDVAAMLAWSRRLLGWAAVPAFALLAAVAALFVETWLGTGYEPVAWSMAILALGWLAAVLSVPTFLVLQATGQEALSTRASLVTATAAIGLAGVLAPGFGLAGVTVGVALGLGAGALAILVLHARAAHQPRLAWPVDVRVLVAAAFGASAAFGLSAGLPAGWLPLLASGGAGAAVYVVVLWLIGGARPGEIAALWRLLRGNPRPGAEP